MNLLILGILTRRSSSAIYMRNGNISRKGCDIKSALIIWRIQQLTTSNTKNKKIIGGYLLFSIFAFH